MENITDKTENDEVFEKNKYSEAKKTELVHKCAWLLEAVTNGEITSVAFCAIYADKQSFGVDWEIIADESLQIVGAVNFLHHNLLTYMSLAIEKQAAKKQAAP